MRAITIAWLLAGCGSVQPDQAPGAAAATYYERNAEPVLAAKCSSNSGGCHANGENVFTLDYATLTEQLDTNFAAEQQSILNPPIALTHANLLQGEALGVIQQWLQLEATARGL